MKYLINILIIISGFTLLMSCNKDADLHGHAIDDEQVPAIDIVLPLMNDSIVAGSNLKLKASVVENDLLHEYGYWIRNKNTGEQYFGFSKHEHKSLINIDSIINTNLIPSGTRLSLQVYATDHSGNTNAKTVEVIVK